MNRALAYLLAIALPTTTFAGPATPERKTVPARYRWNTTRLYSSDAAWDRARNDLVNGFARLATCKGKLRENARVRGCLDLVFGARKTLSRLMTYAHRRHDEDTRVTRYQGLKAVIDKVSADYQSAVAFVEPELLALSKAQLHKLIADPALREYDQYLRELLRRKAHVLSPAEEALWAKTALMRQTGYNLYSTFTAAEVKFGTIKDEQGQAVQLTQQLYGRYRTSPKRAVRKAAFDTLFGGYARYKATLAAMLSAQVNANIAAARARRYKSALAASLDADNVPVAVYDNMIAAVNQHLPLLHRYMRLRKRLMNVDQLRYYDMYPSMLKGVEPKYPYEQGKAQLVSALAPLGPEYLEALKQSLRAEAGWIDVYPNQGKRSGAYMDGDAYDVHPYVLCNYLDDYGSLSTLAHEMGHAMHSHFSNKRQPYAKAGYPIFVAEVASTVNEALLMQALLRRTKDKAQRLFLLGQKLENFRGTLFRQAMFAEFERAVYALAEANKPLTADVLSTTYLELVRRYYGHDKGVSVIDQAYGMEWAYVPHFYYNFYVYQYATGITAATAIARAIEKRGEPARRAYLDNLIKAGGSGYAIDLLTRAGVDLRQRAPYKVALDDFAAALTEVETLTAQ